MAPCRDLLLCAALAQLVSLGASFHFARESTDDPKSLRVSIAKYPPVRAVLSGSLTIPCHVTYLRPPPAAEMASRHGVRGTLRVKWTFLAEGKETEVLVARGLKVKVNDLYHDRVALPFYPDSLTDATLVLSELRYNDSGLYRCEAQHGIEDGQDFLEVKVKGVIFHYRGGSSRYAYTFPQAQAACARIGAAIATPEQLHAAYSSGYEQCDAGWLADQTVRYPIHTPREACYGDMNGLPGIRNYGVVDPEDTYDVYCYVEELYGDLFLVSPPRKFTWEEAKAECQAQGAEMATTGQLYAAWTRGLDHCNPGWLADGSVRYPIVAPREKCGGNNPGVKTLFLFHNQTGFPDPRSRFDVFCFREGSGPSQEPPLPEAESSQAITTVTQKMEELQLSEGEAEGAKESRGAIYSVPLFQEPPGGPEEPSEAFEEAATTQPEEEEEEEEEASPGGCDGQTGGEDPRGGSCARRQGPEQELVEPSAEEGPSTQEAPTPDQKPQWEEGDPETLEAEDGEASEEKEPHDVHDPGRPSPETVAGFSDSLEGWTVGKVHEGPSETVTEGTPGASHAPSSPGAAATGTPSARRAESSSVAGYAPSTLREAGAEPPATVAFLVTPWVPVLLLSGSPEESGDHSGASWPPPPATWSSPVAISTPLDEAVAASEALAGHGEEPDASAEEPPEEASEEEDHRWTTAPWAEGEGHPEAVPSRGPLGLDFFSTPFLEASLTTTHSRPVLPTESASLGASGSVSDSCMPNPCRNGGTCTEGSGRPGCLCLPGYGGDSCDTSLRKCQSGWDVFQGSCYKHFSSRRSWEEAETRCREHGGHLANIMSPEEQSFINNQYREYQWIGLNDRTIEGDFQWSDGSPLVSGAPKTP
ncbi:brevican core protein [Erythrolamprus reginae]|uniref:brevican core protein n=1 Tax=Erythrolamprus reginae TaxID=121349 RepID=UPI00396C99A4